MILIGLNIIRFSFLLILGLCYFLYIQSKPCFYSKSLVKTLFLLHPLNEMPFFGDFCPFVRPSLFLMLSLIFIWLLIALFGI